jgi:hypothetical protein
MRQYLVPVLGRIPLDDLEGQDVQALIDDRRRPREGPGVL